MNVVVDKILALPPGLVLVLVFLLPAVEASAFVGLVVPGEIAVLLGGVLAHSGQLPLWAVVVAAVAGAVAGDQVGYLLGRRYGQGLLTRLPRRLRESDEVDRALELLRRRGAVAVLLGRWAAALRALVPSLAGVSGLPWGRFAAANAIGGAAWATTVAVLGYLAGVSYRVLERRLGLGSEIVLGAAVLAIIIAVLRVRRRHQRQRRT